MGIGESKLRPLTAADHKGIPLLAHLDNQLVAALRSGAIKLLRAKFLRADGSEAMLAKLLRRQELERMEVERGICIFLTPEEAVAALRSLRREVAGLTYGWASPDHPDVTGEYLANVRRFLRHPLGKHVTALFWDFPSLPQKPRSAAEDRLFSQALKVMGDIYASVLGTIVVRHRSVPARPAELDGEVVILVEKGGGFDGAGAEAELPSALGAFENPRFEEGRWRVRFPTHAAAEEAVEAATAAGALPGATAVFLFYNGRPYLARGWTTFESTVSTEALARLAYFPGLGKLLDERLPPKVFEIDGEGPRVAEMEDRADEGMGPRHERVIAAIQEASFTGKGDKPVVVELYREYATKVGNALAYSGEAVQAKYEGEYNAAGEREGRGVMRYTNGNVYEGEFKAGEMEGRGIFRFANGDVYEGEWKAGKMEGRGVFRFANGVVYEGEWKASKHEGRGVERYASGEVYDGEWKADKKEGRGVFRFASGNVYEGEFKADKREGRAVYRFANGNVYEGEFKAGKMEGRGIYRFASGNVYEGEFKADKREGRAVFRWANGNVESGFYKQDAPVGEGVSWDNVDTDAAAKGHHPNVSCDLSGMWPIVGIWYNLIGQPYDLCEAEFEKLSADLKPLYRAIHPGQRSCWRLRDGERVEWISTEEARRTAEWLELPIPSPLPGA